MKVVLAVLLSVALAALAQLAVPPVARVVDQTGTLSTEQKAALERMLEAFEARKGSQIALVMVPTTGGEAIEQYALRVAEQWKLGRKGIDDGALLAIAKDDRVMRVEVGYGLEGALNDATAKRIVADVITPRFREGDFFGGISAGLDRMIRVIDGEPLPEPARSARAVDGGVFQLLPVLLIAALVVGGILRAVLGRALGSMATGGAVGFLAWILAGTLITGVIAGVLAFMVTLGGGSGGRRVAGGFPIGYGGGFGRGGGTWGGGSWGGGGFGGGRRRLWRRRRFGALVMRWLRHVLALPGSVARAFPAHAFANIEAAIRDSERIHSGEIRFAVEAALDPAELWRGVSARERAIAVFSELRVWDTEQNNGVLLYLLLADRDVEIVADRGFNGKVSAEEWEHVCRRMEAALREGRHADAVVAGIEALSPIIARHFPPMPGGRNELADTPTRVR